MSKPITPLLTVDCVVFDSQMRVLLIRRKNDPYKDLLALPGGFVDVGETIISACVREVLEETGLALNATELYFLNYYDAPDRDPRGHTISVAFIVRMDSKTPAVFPGDDAREVHWSSKWRDYQLAFDHRQILEDATKLVTITSFMARATEVFK